MSASVQCSRVKAILAARTLCFALESLKEIWFEEGALSDFGGRCSGGHSCGGEKKEFFGFGGGGGKRVRVLAS